MARHDEAPRSARAIRIDMSVAVDEAEFARLRHLPTNLPPQVGICAGFCSDTVESAQHETRIRPQRVLEAGYSTLLPILQIIRSGSISCA